MLLCFVYLDIKSRNERKALQTQNLKDGTAWFKVLIHHSALVMLKFLFVQYLARKRTKTKRLKIWK